MIKFPIDEVAMPHDEQLQAQDLISGKRNFWIGGSKYVHLDAQQESAHTLHLRQWQHVDYVENRA